MSSDQQKLRPIRSPKQPPIDSFATWCFPLTKNWLHPIRQPCNPPPKTMRGFQKRNQMEHSPASHAASSPQRRDDSDDSSISEIPRVVLPPPGFSGTPRLLGRNTPAFNAPLSREPDSRRLPAFIPDSRNSSPASDFAPSRRQNVNDPRQILVDSPTFKDIYTPMASRPENQLQSPPSQVSYQGTPYSTPQQNTATPLQHLNTPQHHHQRIPNIRGRRPGSQPPPPKKPRRGGGGGDQRRNQKRKQLSPKHESESEASPQRSTPVPPADRLERQRILDERMKSFDEEDDDEFYTGE
ncbi:hypothetical protein M426DRAFT_178366 [Hypoxylon sp. CI-4A]|nr:hypothetical protein M426DRAFT_178366 [Hypoxylon sp. CI-4A]